MDTYRLVAEVIAKVYEGYIVQRAEHRATIKTELAATQIANRLASAIPGTVYRIRTDDTLEAIDTDLLANSDAYKGIQWVGSDTESFSATATPGWSGFIDVDDPANTVNSLSTPGSALATTTAIINNLSTRAPAPVIYFPYDLNGYPATIAGTTISPTGAGTPRIVEQYKLAWSSYAIIREADGNLYLYYDFVATPATALGNRFSLLMNNVSSFKFQGAGRTIRFKICKEEDIGENFNVTSCKEKVVF